MKPSKLFHAVVVVGASLTGCGGSEGGEDAGADSGPVADAGPMDAGPMDAGPMDAGPMDAGPMDAGDTDGAFPEDAPHDATGDDGMVLIL